MHDLLAILLRQGFFYRKLRSDIGLRDWSYVQILSEFKILLEDGMNPLYCGIGYLVNAGGGENYLGYLPLITLSSLTMLVTLIPLILRFRKEDENAQKINQ